MAIDINPDKFFNEEQNASVTETETSFVHDGAAFKSNSLAITNDDGAINILIRFNTRTGNVQRTIPAGETLTIDFVTKSIFIQAASGTPAYRLVVTGQ